MIGYPRSWTASEEPEDQTGTAKFKIDGVEYTIRLNSFEDFQTIGRMLDVAFAQGRTFGCQAIRDVVFRAANKRAMELGVG